MISNLKIKTVEKAVRKKKSMHMAAFKYLAEELSPHLENVANKESIKKPFKEDVTKNQGGRFLVEFMINAIVDQCKGRSRIKWHSVVQ